MGKTSILNKQGDGDWGLEKLKNVLKFSQIAVA